MIPTHFNVSEKIHEISNINFILPEYLKTLNNLYSGTKNNT